MGLGDMQFCISLHVLNLHICHIGVIIQTGCIARNVLHLDFEWHGIARGVLIDLSACLLKTCFCLLDQLNCL